VSVIATCPLYLGLASFVTQHAGDILALPPSQLPLLAVQGSPLEFPTVRRLWGEPSDFMLLRAFFISVQLLEQ
jgi:hypothetical protein